MSISHEDFRSFPDTRWSLVDRAGDSDPHVRKRAINELLTKYRPAFIAFLIRCLKCDHHTAEDVTQEVIVKILEGVLPSLEVQGKHSLRSYFRLRLRNAMIDVRRKSKVHVEVQPDQVGASEQEPDPFDLAWAGEVFRSTFRRMKQECEEKGRTDWWVIFETRCLKPTHGDPHEPSTLLEDVDADISGRVRDQAVLENLRDRFGLGSIKDVSNKLVQAKRMFQRTLGEVVGEYTGNEEFDEEIGHMLKICAQAGTNFWKD